MKLNLLLTHCTWVCTSRLSPLYHIYAAVTLPHLNYDYHPNGMRYPKILHIENKCNVSAK